VCRCCIWIQLIASVVCGTCRSLSHSCSHIYSRIEGQYCILLPDMIARHGVSNAAMFSPSNQMYSAATSSTESLQCCRDWLLVCQTVAQDRMAKINMGPQQDTIAFVKCVLLTIISMQRASCPCCLISRSLSHCKWTVRTGRQDSDTRMEGLLTAFAIITGCELHAAKAAVMPGTIASREYEASHRAGCIASRQHSSIASAHTSPCT
jgi:hypothetical protein